VTNATFEPLTIKLLAPHEDFRRTTFGALNYYVFNRSLAPFDDVRVREAFAIAIDRGRLSRDTLGGATEPAFTFLPEEMTTAHADKDADNPRHLIRTDQRRARQLLAAAGFPDGRGFPVVRLLINRNDTHRAVGQAVAGMWRKELGIETEIIVKDWSEYEAALKSGDYMIARRSSVMQTPDERANIETLFSDAAEKNNMNEAAKVAKPDDETAGTQATPSANASPPTEAISPIVQSTPAIITTHEQALREFPGIPLYFASSYALVKPYILDFNQNLFDAPVLKGVRINGEWKFPDKQKAVFTKSS
jgi:oligopeptide transport system substrate-binding protein